MKKIVTWVKAGKILYLTILMSLALSVIAFSSVPANAARVAVTVEKFTLRQGFIVEPAFVTLEDGDTAASVTTRLLESKFPEVKKAYSSAGSDETFYLKGVYDPSRGGILSEFDEGNQSGWMITVNNFFIRTSAGVLPLSDGDVIRWQYTKELGVDLGEDINHPGASTRADKDGLVWKLAEINAAGNKSAYGSDYTNAVSVLTNPDAAQSAVDSALSALNAGPTAANPEEPDGPGGGCDAGTGALALLALALTGGIRGREE